VSSLSYKLPGPDAAIQDLLREAGIGLGALAGFFGAGGRDRASHQGGSHWRVQRGGADAVLEHGATDASQRGLVIHL